MAQNDTQLGEWNVRRWVPALKWLKTYDPSWLRGDLVAGLTLAAYLLPAGPSLTGPIQAFAELFCQFGHRQNFALSIFGQQRAFFTA
jgi:MFS superfamily sulfate permease-like transporter